MSPAEPRQKMTREEYLEFELTAEVRHEFYRGEIFAMSGGSATHSRIKTNLITFLNFQTLEKGCQTFDSDMRLKVESTGLYTYPDASVTCGKPSFEDERQITLLNPLAVFEVLSPSTERYDRGKKFDFYREIPSLQHYVLISQEGPHVEVFSRRDDGQWAIGFSKGLDGVIELPEIGCVIRLSELYHSIDFSRAETPETHYESHPIRRPGD